MQSYRFKIIGLVQDVYYRANVKKNACASGFSGYVKNLEDGSVEACVTCSEDSLNEFVNILKKGSPASVVDEIQTLTCNEVFEKEFNIEY